MRQSPATQLSGTRSLLLSSSKAIECTSSRDEVHSIALELLSSKDLVPESWVAGLCRTVSGLVAAVAQLMESLEDSATENADPYASLRISTHTSPFVRTERT